MADDTAPLFALIEKVAPVLERWPGKTGQWYKWIFCLTVANVAA